MLACLVSKVPCRKSGSSTGKLQARVSAAGELIATELHIVRFLYVEADFFTGLHCMLDLKPVFPMLCEKS